MQEKESETQQEIRFRFNQRTERIANDISGFSFTVVAAVLTRFIADRITDPKEYEQLLKQMQEAEREIGNG